MKWYSQLLQNTVWWVLLLLLPLFISLSSFHFCLSNLLFSSYLPSHYLLSHYYSCVCGVCVCGVCGVCSSFLLTTIFFLFLLVGRKFRWNQIDCQSIDWRNGVDMDRRRKRGMYCRHARCISFCGRDQSLFRWWWTLTLYINILGEKREMGRKNGYYELGWRVRKWN